MTVTVDARERVAQAILRALKEQEEKGAPYVWLDDEVDPDLANVLIDGNVSLLGLAYSAIEATRKHLAEEILKADLFQHGFPCGEDVPAGCGQAIGATRKAIANLVRGRT